MRLSTTLSLMALLTAPVAAQSNKPFDPAKLLVGNTLTGIYEEGKIEMRAKADGTVLFTPPDGKTFTGHWVANREYLCIINPPEKPNDGLPTRCEKVDLAKRQIGVSWTMIDSYGLKTTVTIRRGQ